MELKNLMDLKFIKHKNTNIRALAFHLYENNGVVKRENVKELTERLNQEDRKILRNLGVKFGRYHIFLFRLFKPSAVLFRILLWKNFHQKFFDLEPPTFGLNFLENKKTTNQNFMLLCGFEKFENFYVRIDILERLFLIIIEKKGKEGNDIKLLPNMLNLLGCNKDNFLKLIQKMNYKHYEKDGEIYFKYISNKAIKKNKFKKFTSDNPFNILKELRLK